jgi:demethylmenaquinone methyltransferase/2-methoxy-6-polyprenyl-1,4-benzoquinol methylase
MNKGVQQIFSEVPKTYELVNHILTFGLDILWRKKAAKAAAKNCGGRWLDCCSGTGETAVNLKRLAENGTKVVAVDFCEPMLRVAKQKKEADGIFYAVADAGVLPFPDNSFDLITISFAARNINTNRKNFISILSEFCRVLKKGGHFICLETSQPHNKFVKRLFHLYVRLTVRLIGEAISGSRAGYKYLSHTIPRFYGPGEFATVLREAGFSSVDYSRMLLGVTAIHTAVK